MSQNTNHVSLGDAEESKLNRLVRAAVAGQETDTPWPETDAILAYLKGDGSDEQRREVQEAIADSTRFRLFLLDTANQIDRLPSPEVMREFDRMSHVAQTSSKGSQATQPTVFEGFGKWLAGLIRRPVLAPALAVVTLLVIGLALDPMGWRGRSDQAFTQLDPGNFSELRTRSGEQPAPIPEVARTPYDAALNELRRCVTLDLKSGEFTLQDNPRHTAGDPNMQTVTLSVVNGEGISVRQLTTHVPVGADLADESVKAWVLSVPSMMLWRTDLSGPSADIQWTTQMGDRGCVTVTYPVETGFRATPGRSISR